MTAYILNLLDLLFTLYAIKNGTYELNPLMQSVPIMIIYKVFVVGALLWWLSGAEGKIARYGRRICTAVFAAVDLWHIYNLILILGIIWQNVNIHSYNFEINQIPYDAEKFH